MPYSPPSPFSITRAVRLRLIAMKRSGCPALAAQILAAAPATRPAALAEEQPFDFPAGVFLQHEPRRNDAGVVEDQQIAGSQQRGQVRECAVGDRSIGRAVVEKARRRRGRRAGACAISSGGRWKSSSSVRIKVSTVGVGRVQLQRGDAAVLRRDRRVAATHHPA